MKNFTKIIYTFLTVLIGIFSFGSVALADYYTTTTATTSGSFVVPLGVTSLNVSLTAAGGGGAGGAFTYGGGGGGAGSSISNIVISVTPGQVIPYTVGTGGSAGNTGYYAASGGNGGNGENTIFNITNTVLGGHGGSGAVVGGGGGQGGATGGIGGTNGANGDSFVGERYYGGNGGTSLSGTGGIGGYGSASTYTLPTAGVNGNGGGGGSGWAYNINPTYRDAGTAGGNGLIVVSYYADLTIPVITLNGSSTVVIATNSVYTDLGATAIDNIDGDITANIITTGLPINTSATGTHSVIYTVTDHAGNTLSIARTVTVADQTAPVITVPATQIFEATGFTTTPVLTPATATDNIDPSPVVTYSPATFNLGTTTVLWTATDSSGNFATGTSDVFIKDTTAPVITINGSSTMSFMVGGLYTELGASATDLVDGSTAINILGSVNANATGTYFIIYSSIDSSGNSTSVFRTVNVMTDITPPVIIAPIDQTFEATGPVTVPTLILATSTDNATLNPVITYTPNSFNLGTTTVVWTATDAANNFSTTSSDVIIKDTTSPTITINGSSTVNLLVGDTYTELGASSTDIVDGNIIVVVSGVVDTSATGTYNVLYTATDLSFNFSTTSRTVIVSDVSLALASISISPLSPSLNVGATTTFISTTLDQNGNPFATITSWNSSSSSVGTIDAAGLFTAIAAGTTTITGTAGIFSTSTIVTVTAVVDVTAPIITVLGSNPVTVVAGTNYVDAGATSTDNINGDLTSSIITTNPVSSSTPVGVYTVTYTVSDAALNSATGTRTVNVVAIADIISPVITILGANPVNIILGATYTDAGATSTDNIDGDITSHIITTGLPINTSATGTQLVTYSVTDGAGNSTSSIRTVNIIAAPVDNVAPVITITGGTPTAIIVGSTYTDQGATAFDNVDGTTTISIILNNVNANATGTYSVTYSATDLSGNIATSSRTVNVIATPADLTAPVITIIGGTPTTVIASSTYTDQGATSTDNVDVTVTVSATGTVDTNILGTYFIVYTAVDSSLNLANATRTVNVVEASSTDIIPPVITVINGTPSTIIMGGTYVDDGAIAYDAYDNATTTATSSGVVNTAVIGTYTITYTASDIAGNIATAIRQVNVIAVPVDLIAPIITITGGSPITILASSTYTDAGAISYDSYDNATTTLVGVSNVDTNIIGSYTVVYSANDIALNNSTATRTVNVIAKDIAAPVITVLGTNPLNVIKTLSYIEPGVVAIDGFDGPVGIVTSGSVDTSATGTYILIYTATDSSGNAASSTRTVNVIDDNIAPVITILGSNPVNLTVGGAYIDAGATALDNVDGNLTVNIATSSDVNINATGTYSVIYTVTDATGNIASSTRIVNVNPVPPVTLSSIAIITPANKLSYTVGETLDITGLVVQGTYSDGSTSTEVITVGNMSGFNSGSAVVGQVLTITVGIRTTTYTVNINAAPVVVLSGGGGGGIMQSSVAGDINSDNKIDEYDFSIMMSQWGKMLSGLSSDLNHDGKIDEYDFSLLMFNWK